MAILEFSVVLACRFTENDVLCEWMTGANGPDLHTAGAEDAYLPTWFQRRGQKPMIRTREVQCEGRRGQKGRICTRESDDVCKSGYSAPVVWGVPWGIAGF